jgi:manganese transport protein
VLHVAFYQAYLTQDKGWGVNDLKTGFRDTVASIIMLAGITIMIVMTSATVLHPRGITIATAADMARQLESLFGPFAKIVFSVGLWAAAFSSLAVNAVVGGGLLADGLGMGRSMDDKAPRYFTILSMVIGMVIAMILLNVNRNIVSHLIVAQASTLFAVPAVAVGLFLIANNKKVMGGYANTWKVNVLAVFGMALIFLMVYYKYSQLFTQLGKH